MNQKELNELRRHIAPNRCAISRLYGCFVSAGGEILSSFEDSLGLMSEFETEKYLSLLKKVLSGALGVSLREIVFSTKQVMDSPEHKRLMALRDTELKDPALREAFFQTVITSLTPADTPYLILLAHDTYDVPYRGKDDETQADASDQAFSYILCAICPIKEEKPALAYSPEDKRFHTRGVHQLVASPELGFLFPAFDQRAANIYQALYYVKSSEQVHQEFLDGLFRTEPLLSAAQQKEAFQESLSGSLEELCSYDVVQGIHEQLRERIEQHKESRDPEPLTLSVQEVGAMLRDCGIPEPQAQAFEKACTQQFGAGTPLNPSNLLDSKKFKLETPQLSISIDPESSGLIEVRVIRGRKYLLLPVHDGATVNGIPIRFPSEEG